MVALLVALTVAAFLLADWYWVRSRRKAAAFLSQVAASTANAREADDPAGLLFDPAHVWTRVETDGTATLGLTDVTAHLAGRVTQIDLPAPGRRLGRGRDAWTLFNARGRRLTQRMPFAARVLEVNEALRRRPDLLLTDPYDSGWLMRVKIRQPFTALKSLLRGSEARAWLDETRTQLATRLSPALGHAALDGGEWATAFGDELDDVSWERIRKELVNGKGPLGAVPPVPMRIP